MRSVVIIPKILLFISIGLVLSISLAAKASDSQVVESKLFIVSLPLGKTWIKTSENDYRVVFNSFDKEEEKVYTLFVSGFSSKSKGTGDDFVKEVEGHFNSLIPRSYSVTSKKIYGLEKSKYSCITGEMTGENPQAVKILSKFTVCRNPYYEGTGFMAGYSVTGEKLNESLPDMKNIVDSIKLKP